MPEPATQPEPGSSAEQLLAFKIEDNVKAKLLKWAKQQFAPVAAAINVAAFLGLSGLLYTTFNTSIDKAVDEAVKDTLSRVRESANAELARLDEQRRQTEEVRLDLRRAQQEAKDVSERAKNDLAELSRNYQTAVEFVNKKVSDLSSEVNSIKKAADQVRVNVDATEANLDKFGADVYKKADLAADVIAEQIARLNALEMVVGRTAMRATAKLEAGTPEADSLEQIVEAHLASLEENRQTMVILFLQSFKGLNEYAERWALRLKLKGFQTEIYYTDKEGYHEAKETIAHSVPDLVDLVNLRDACLIYRPGELAAANQVSDVIALRDFDSECMEQKKLSLGEFITSDLNKKGRKFNKLLFAYVAVPS